MATPHGKREPGSVAMPRPATRDHDARIIARFVIAALDSGSRIILRERPPNPWAAASPSPVYRLPMGFLPLARTLNSLAGGTFGDGSPGGAIDLILEQTLTIPAACVLLGRPATEIMALVDRGELGGLCINGDWFLSRSGVGGLVVIADAEKWFREHGLRYDAP